MSDLREQVESAISDALEPEALNYPPVVKLLANAVLAAVRERMSEATVARAIQDADGSVLQATMNVMALIEEEL